MRSTLAANTRACLMVCAVFAHMAAAAAAGGLYVQLPTDGESCESAGLLYIETKEECEVAAADLQLAETTAASTVNTDYPYGCYFRTDVINLGIGLNPDAKTMYDNTRMSGTRLVSICKMPQPEPIVEYPALGWVAFNNYLTQGSDDDDYFDYLYMEQLSMEQRVLSYAIIQLLPVVAIGLLIAYPTVVLCVWALQALYIPGKFLWKWCQSDWDNALKAYEAFTFVRIPFLDIIEGGEGTQENTINIATQIGWAKRKAKTKSRLTKYGLFLIVPLVVIQRAALESKRFNMEDEGSLLVAPCTTEGFDQDASGNGDSDSYSADDAPLIMTAPSTSLKFRHEGICQTVADGYDCFATDFEAPFFASFMVEARRANRSAARYEPLACSADGFVDLAHTCDNPQEIQCFKLREQTPIAWLDGLGIAAGILLLFVEGFQELDRFFRIGKEEPGSTLWLCSHTVTVRQSCSLSCNISGGLLLYGTSISIVTKVVLYGAITIVDAVISYGAPVLFIAFYFLVCGDHIGAFDTGTCRYAILEKLFDAYAEDFSNDPAKATEATAKYWTPASTARLLDQVKSSISFPDRDEAVQLDGYQLTQYMADGYDRRVAQKVEDKKDAVVREKLESPDSKDTGSTTIEMPPADGEADEERVARIKKEMEAVRAMFDSVDAVNADGKKDGKVSKEELAAKLETDAKLKGMLEDAGIATDFYVLEQVDTDEDGHISFDEFKEAIIVDGKWTTDSLNRGIFAFVCAIKSMPAKFEAYRNPKMPVGSISFSEVWTATWGSMLTDADLKNKHGQCWWELGADKQNFALSAAPASDSNADFGFAEPDIIVFDGNDSDGSNADGGDNVQF